MRAASNFAGNKSFSNGFFMHPGPVSNHDSYQFFIFVSFVCFVLSLITLYIAFTIWFRDHAFPYGSLTSHTNKVQRPDA